MRKPSLIPSEAVLKSFAVLCSALIVFACATRPLNEPIDQVDPDSGYRPHLLAGNSENNDPSTLFVLSFSGGGTRAAALSNGVLEELNRYQFYIEGQP